jgi:phosphoglycerate dehydrogenase-like enzyme
MSHAVLYLGRTPQAHRDVTLSVQPPEFHDLWIESDDPPEPKARLAEAEFLVAGRVTSDMLDQAPRLRMIQMPGVGYEHIDVAACEARGIPVAITPGARCRVSSATEPRPYRPPASDSTN